MPRGALRFALMGPLLSALLLVACGGRLSGSEPPLRVVVSIPPLVGLVRPFLPAGTEIKVLMPPGRSEHGYEMTSADFALIARANVLVYVGLGLEPRIEEFVRKRPSVDRSDLSFAAALKIDAGEGAGHEDHEHEEGGDHEGHHHGPVDPHLWLDPVLVEEFIPAIRDAVRDAEKRRGLLTEAEQARLIDVGDELIAKVGSFHEVSKSRVGDHKGKYIVTHHAAWGRLASRYGLQVAAVLRPIETSEPTPAAIAAAIEAIKRENVRAIFVEPQFDRAAAKKVADATNVNVCSLDPIGDGDWFEMMRRNILVLETCLGSREVMKPGSTGAPPAPTQGAAPEPPRAPGR